MRNVSKRQLLAFLLSFSMIFSDVIISSAAGNVNESVSQEYESGTYEINENVKTEDDAEAETDILESNEEIKGSESAESSVETESIESTESSEEIKSSESTESSEEVKSSETIEPGESSESSEYESGSEEPSNVSADGNFVVTDNTGAQFGVYDNWEELLTVFKNKGNTSKEYTILIADDAVIGNALPSKAGKVTLKTRNNGTLKFASATMNMTVALVIEADEICVSGTGKPVNINTKGKSLTLIGTGNVGTVKGSSSGSLSTAGDVEIKGALQTFKNVNVDGTLKIEGNTTSVSNLDLKNGRIYLTEGKKFTVSNVSAGDGGALIYPSADGAGGNSKMPEVKISGTVTGKLTLIRAAGEGDSEQYFTAGTKLLTASKAKADQFVVHGERKVCYKKGSAIYVGAEVLQLYEENDTSVQDAPLGVYAQWSDVTARINQLNKRNAAYRIVLLDDFVADGALTMPGKGKYSGITIDRAAVEGKEEEHTLLKAGKLSLTADLTLSPDIRFQVNSIAGTGRKLTVSENAKAEVSGTVTVDTLILKKGASVRSDGKFTVKKLLQAEEDTELILTQKKGASIKDTNVAKDSYIAVKILDKNDTRVTLTQNTTLFTVSGSSYAVQFHLLDKDDNVLELYRKGKAIKVKGTVETPVGLYYVTEDGETDLGTYMALSDIKTEISRRKDSKAVYRLEVQKELFVKGAVPFPSAGSYGKIMITGERILTTGNIKLTGDTVFYNEIRKVKNAQNSSPLELGVNLSKYTLTIAKDSVIDNLGTVTGVANSCLNIEDGAEQSVSGNLNVSKLVLGRTINVKGNIVVADILPNKGNVLRYNIAKSITIKGNVLGDGEKLILAPMRNGQILSGYTEGLKVLNSAPKADMGRIRMINETPYVLYRDGGAVKLGSSVITIFENTSDYESCLDADKQGNPGFVRINDAIDYINGSNVNDFVVRLDGDVSSSGAFTMPSKGKNLTLCGIHGDKKTLNMTGAITLDGSAMNIVNIKLDNKTSAGVGMTLKNGASLSLSDTAINTLSAPAGTTVTLSGEISINGAFSGSCALNVMPGTLIRSNGNIAVNNIYLKTVPQTDEYAEIRLLSNRTMTVSGSVDTGDKGYFIINKVNKKDELADISEGTSMITAQHGEASQFKTHNIMPGKFTRWSLVKNGSNIKTVETSEGTGEWSRDYL